MKSRAEAVRELASRTFDVCVIGAGATGAGCALDAQLRGLQTALIDTGDFGSATSSASTKLVHGGVRYLQEGVTHADLGQLRVVKHALRERIFMLRNAPHLAQRLEFIVPCFSSFDLAYYGVGMKIYEWISSRATLGPSRILSRADVLTELPDLNSDRLHGAVSYWDGQFDDARYCVTLVKTFANAGGETASYLKAVDFERDTTGRLSAVMVEDRRSGRKFLIRARGFVNATGPFSDRLRRLVNPHALKKLAPSKGVHILLPLENGFSRALLIPKTEDGRVIFAIPWRGRLLVGTTDEEVELSDELSVTQKEADYLLRHLNQYVSKHYGREDVVAVFSGVRPLVKADHEETKELSRDHVIEVDQPSGLVSILGGKWTTYRYMAEQTIDAVQRELGHAPPNGASSPSKTRQYPLAGAAGYRDDYWQSLAYDHALDEATARHLSEKFGADANAIIALIKEDPDLRTPIVDGAAPILAEILYSIRNEMACTIEDVLARRIGMQFYSLAMAIAAAPVVASHLAKEQRWSRPEELAAIDEYVRQIRHMQEVAGIRTN
jgi:glycerol-3-phosphate dehydrogenase